MSKLDTAESLAFKTLLKAGREHWKPEANPSKGQIIGSAIYRFIDYPIDAYHLAAEICEQNNWHEHAKKLRDLGNPF